MHTQAHLSRLIVQFNSNCVVNKTVGDITGTTISSDLPIFVTSGAGAASVGILYSPDGIMETLPSVDNIGCLYVVIPVASRNNGDKIRIIGKCIMNLFKGTMPPYYSHCYFIIIMIIVEILSTIRV